MKNNKSRTNIPHGWSKCRLNEVADFFNGKGHEKNINENGKYVVVNSKFISTNGKIRKYCNEFLAPLQKDDVVMVMSDVPNGKAIAKCFFVDKNNKYTLNQRIGGFKSKNIFNKFLFLAINRNRYFLSFDDGVNQTNLRKDDILACPLILPPLPEQKRIVSVLETWDQMIEKLARKIEIKKSVKKGLMQNLLTGKVRLAGFKDEWKEVKLGDICDIKTGNKNNQDKISNGKYPFFVRSQNIERINSYSYDGEAILIPGEGNIGKIFHYINGKFDYHQRVYKISDFKNNVFGKYIYYYFAKNFSKQTKSDSVKATVDSLRLPTFQNFKIKLPSPKEQIEIAKILSLAEEEIKSLEKKLSIIKDQKKYLLDNLVTGQIRVPEFKK